MNGGRPGMAQAAKLPHSDRMNNTFLPLITAATGKTGRRIVARLEAQGIQVRAGVRTAPVPFDWSKPETWEPALSGTSAAYICYHSDIAFPGAFEHVSDFTARAVKAGVRKLVLLSGRGEPTAQRAEKVVQESGVAWTIVRASWFNQNFSESFFQPQIVSGHVPFVSNGVREPFIDTDDIADVAASALLDSKHDGQLYEVTGPRLLTFADATDEIAAVINRPVRYEEVTPEQYLELAVADGVPPDFAKPLVDLLREVLDGRNASVTDGVERALERRAKDFGQFVREAAAAGAWNR